MISEILNDFKKLQLKSKILLILCLILTVGFCIQSILKGLSNSCDLMWQPSKLFWEGINHYDYQLKTRDIFLGCQKGQYGHGLFVLLYPISFLDWHHAKIGWIIINVFLSISIPILICRNFKISNLQLIYILMVFLTCHPTRMSLNLGQNSLLILFFIMLPFIKLKLNNKYIVYILSGFSYVKYSTGYVLFLFLLINKNIKFLIASILISLISWLFYSYYTDSNLINSFIGPFKLIFFDNYTRTGDIYSILNLYILKSNSILNKALILSLILILNLFFLLKIKKTNDYLAKLSVVCLLPLIFLPHSNYDYVLLLPLFVYGVKNMKFIYGKVSLCLTLYYFYFNRLIRHWVDNDIIYQTGICLIFFIFLYSFTNFIKKKCLISI